MSKFCTNCGSSIEDDQNKCQYCGKDLNESDATSNAGVTSVAGASNTANSEGKSKLVAGLLGIFLGAWGIHNFYIGNTSRAIIQIVVSIVTCGVGGLWGFIEGILILCGSINTDADGNPLV